MQTLYPKKTLYLVRHCKAAGQKPAAALTETGRRQAEELAELFEGYSVDSIISSPFVRAMQTVQPLAERLQLTVRVDARLAERVLCGEDRTDWQDMMRASFSMPDLCYEGGESGRTAAERGMLALTDVLESNFRNSVVVTHGNMLALLLNRYDNRFGYKEWEAMTNPDVYRLTFTGKVPDIQRVWRKD